MPGFNSNRMIEEYTRNFYMKAAERHTKLMANNFEFAKKFADWKKFLAANWSADQDSEGRR